MLLVYGGPSVSGHFCFINIIFTLNAFHSEVNVNANTTHFKFHSYSELILFFILDIIIKKKKNFKFCIAQRCQHKKYSEFLAINIYANVLRLHIINLSRLCDILRFVDLNRLSDHEKMKRWTW